VEVSNLSFRYGGGREVLSNVSLEALPGEIVAIVGPSGAGKTTLLSLLPRFYEATHGTIAIDGHDITGVTVDSLRGAMAIVPQETTLFGGTVRENIAYGREGATDEDIKIAARAASAHESHPGAPPGLRFDRRRPGRETERRPAATRGHRPRHPAQSAHPDPGTKPPVRSTTNQRRWCKTR